MSLQNKTFNELITFTRATGGGRFNAAGQYEWLSANQPRFDFDPVTLEPRGILIEEQRTNLLLRSAEFDNSSWGKARSSITANTVVAPDGTLTADKLVEDTTNNSHFTSQTLNLTAGTTYALSVFAKAAERPRVQLQTANVANWAQSVAATFDLVSGTVVGGNGVITHVGNGWYRCTIIATFGGANAAGGLNVITTPSDTTNQVYQGDGTSGLYIWGAQLEGGSFPTSYIPTTTAQVTRAADVCSVNNLSPWYRADEGTLMVDFVNRSTVTPPAVSEDFACIADSSADSRISIVRPAGYSTLRGSVFSSVAAQADITLGTVVPDQRRVAAIAFKKDYFAASANGGVVGKDNSGVVPSVTKLGVGSRGTGFAYANGHIRRIRYIPRRISDTELQALTAI